MAGWGGVGRVNGRDTGVDESSSQVAHGYKDKPGRVCVGPQLGEGCVRRTGGGWFVCEAPCGAASDGCQKQADKRRQANRVKMVQAGSRDSRA